MNKKYKKLEEEYTMLFKERPWILKYMNLTLEEQLELLEKSIKENKRIEIDK